MPFQVSKIMQLVLGAALVVAYAVPKAASKAAAKPQSRTTTAAATVSTLDEMLSYECAKSVSSMLYPSDQLGPIFSDANLVFTSIETSEGHPILIVNAGGGTYSVALESAGVNRIRFSMPTGLGSTPMTYFISYLHGQQTRSRVFDFGVGRPGAGKDELDYTQVSAQRAPTLLGHLEYAIYRTSANTLSSLIDGRIDRAQVRRQPAQNCEHIARKSPEVARNLNRDLDQVGMMLDGPVVANVSEPLLQTGAAKKRMPANVSDTFLPPSAARQR